MGLFSTVTKGVLWWLSWIHIRRQLPEDLEGPFGWRGGGGQTISLGNGEQLEFVLIPPPASLWFQRQPPSNPKRKDEEGKPALGAPPLLIWLLALPLLLVSGAVILWFFWFFFNQGVEALPPVWLLVLAAASGLVLFAPVYWGYEWNRRHYRLVTTTLMAYIVSFKAITREYHRSPSPLALVEEVVLDSTWSDKPGLLGRLFGGWLQETRDVGDAFMGTRVMGAADFLRFFPHISSLGEIFTQLNSKAKAHKATKDLARQMANELQFAGVAEEAVIGVSLAGARSPLAEAYRKAEAILALWRRDNPSGESLNLIDPRILGFTRWNLETGEPLLEGGGP